MLAEERRAQFLMVVVDACLGAALARLRVDVQLAGGGSVTGVPAPPVPADEPDALGEIGYPRTLALDSRELDLQGVVAITIHAPAHGEPPYD